MKRVVCTAVLAALAGLFAIGPRVATVWAAGGDPHAYFDALVARPDLIKAYSLRNQAQLRRRADGGYAYDNRNPLNITYDPANDPDPRRQDAAKAVVPATRNALGNQVRLPFSHGQDGFLVTWDVYWTDDFLYEKHGIPTYKAFQLAAPAGDIRTEVRSRFSQADPGRIGTVDIRSYSETEVPLGPADSLAPMLTQFHTAPNVWTRYWVRVRESGRFRDESIGAKWWEVSLWVADENRDPVQLLNNTGQRRAGEWQELWLELATSHVPVRPGRTDLVLYLRNVAILRNVNDPAHLLRRPNAGVPLPPPPNVQPSAPRNLRIL